MAACCAILEAAQAAITFNGALFPTCYGSEFVSRDLDLWAYARKVTLDFSRPGKPTDNGFIEAFNSRLRAECLNAHWFMSLADAAEKLEDWRKHYNDCLIPRFDGAILSQEWKEALWARFVTEAPRPRTPSELQYNDRKLRSRH